MYIKCALNDVFLKLFGATVEFSSVEIVFFSAMDKHFVDGPGRKSGVISVLLHVVNTLLAISVLCATDSSIYPSATVDDFQPPCFFSVIKSPPDSTKNVADDLLNE